MCKMYREEKLSTHDRLAKVQLVVEIHEFRRVHLISFLGRQVVNELVDRSFAVVVDVGIVGTAPAKE